MKINIANKRIFIIVLAVILAIGMMSVVFADAAKPSIDFTNSGVTYNKETKLLRFNLEWESSDDDGIIIMYSIDNSDPKKLGEYNDPNQQIIAHIYLEGEDASGSLLSLYAVDPNGNESKKITSEFRIDSSPGVTIEDGAVPLSSSEGTWSLINLFLTALSVAMAAISLMLFFENRNIKRFKKGGRVKSILFMLLTLIFAGGDIALLLTTQNLKHEMVMFDNMTITMLLIAILSVVTTMVLAVRAFGAQSDRDAVKNG